MPHDLIPVSALDGEILAPGEGGISVLGAPHPFRAEQVKLEVPPGLTVREILDLSLDAAGVPRGLAKYVHVSVERDGHEMPLAPEHFARIRPKPGTHMVFRVVPKGGGGGGKNPLRTVLMMAVTVAAMVAAPYLAGPAVLGLTGAAFGVGQGLIGAGIMLVGTMLVNAIAPPRLPQLDSPGSNAGESPTYRLAGARNVSNPYGPVASILGRHRVHPAYGARPYTEMVGQDNYLRMLFVFGYGPLHVEDIRIGETPITDYTDWEMELRGVQGSNLPGTILADDEPFSLYPAQVTEAEVGVVLTQGVWVTRTSQDDADELSVDIDFPQGLVRFSGNDGGRRNRTVEVEIEYRAAGEVDWTPVTVLSWTERSARALRFGHRWKVDRGQYDVRVRRLSPLQESDRIFDSSTWSILRSITDEDPLKFDQPLAAMALRIKASEQLSGVIDRLNALCTTICPDYEAGAWVTRPTRNPASLYRHVLQGPANARARTNEQVDLGAIEAWHSFCAQEGFTFDMVRDFEASVWSTLADIASAGRAAPSILDGRWSVVIDGAGKPIAQHLTPRNSWGFSAERVYRHLPHGWRVRFVNEDNGYSQDERIVYDDGYDEDNATLFEGLELPGVTNSDLVWKHGRYHIATARLRPEVYSFMMDFEHIVFRRGDLVRVTHDVTMWGLGAGRIKEVTVSGSEATGVVLDEPLPAETGKDYAIRVRRSDGASWLRAVNNPGGASFALTFAEPVPTGQAPEVGDLVQFGEAGQESVELIIRSIEPGQDLTARVTAIDYAPAVYDADQGPIPPWDPQVTLPPDITEQAPEVPRIVGIVTGTVPLQSGRDEPRIVVTIAQFSGVVPVRWVETRHRIVGSEQPWVITRADAEDGQIVIRDVELGNDEDGEVHYHVAARSVSPWEVRSAWSDEIDTEGAGDLLAPGPVESLTAEGGIRQIALSWVNPDDADLRWVEVWTNTTDDRGNATRLARVSGTGYIHAGLGGLVTRWYWVRAVDESGNIGLWNAEEGTSATTEQVSHGDMAKWFVDRSLLLPDIYTKIDKIPLIEETLSGIERFGGRHRERTTKGFAEVRENIHVLYDDTQAIAERTTTIEAIFGDPDDPAAGTAWAVIYENQQAIASEGEARAQQITAVQAEVDTNTASIIQAFDAIADEEHARAQAITAVQVEVDANAAGIVQAFDAIADETSARAQAIATVEASVGDNLALIQDNQQAIADESSARATAVSQLQASIGNNAAVIQDNQQAIADETSARAQAITTLQAEVDGNFAAIQTNQQVIANVDGLLQAQYTLKVQAGDVIAGFGLAADSTTGSEMVFAADRFAMVIPGANGGEPQYPFVAGLVDGQVQVSLPSTFIQDASLPGIKLEDGAITARQLAIGDFTNLVPNPVFEEGSNHSWRNWPSGWSVAERGSSLGNASAPTQYMGIAPTDPSNQTAYASTRVPVKAGEQFYASMDYTSGGGDPRDVTMRLTWRYIAADGSFLSLTSIDGSTNQITWSALEGTRTVPAGAAFVELLVTRVGGGNGRGIFTNVVFRHVTPGTLIENDSITTGKVRANTIIAEHIIGSGVNDTYSTSVAAITVLETTDNDPRASNHNIASYTTTPEGQGRIYFWISNRYSPENTVLYASKGTGAGALGQANTWLRAKYGATTITLDSQGVTYSEGTTLVESHIRGCYGFLAPGPNTTVTFEAAFETQGGGGQHRHRVEAVRVMILECKR